MASPAAADAMNETMTPAAAARVLADAAGFEASLQQRTEGITQMVWALTGTAIFMSYAFAEIYDGFPSWGYALLWTPWVFAGGALTGCLWRSAGLAAPQMKDPTGPVGYLLRFVALTLTLGAIFTFWDPEHFAAPLLVIGAMYLFFALANFYKISSVGRRLYAMVGVGLLGVGAALVTQPETGWIIAVTVGTAGLLPFAAGYWQTLRG